MIIAKIKTSMILEELIEKMEAIDGVLVNPEKIRSLEEIKLAEYLTEKAFKTKRNIVKKTKYEFLLWLTGKTDLKSAFKEINPNKKKMILIIFSGNKKEVLKKLNAQEIKLSLNKNATALNLERITLSRNNN